MRRIHGDALRESARCRSQLVVRHDLRHETTSKRGTRIKRIARKRHLACLGIAHDVLQQPRTAVAGDKAELDEAFREPRAFGGDADVAHAGKVATGADGRSVDGSDDRDFERFERARNALDTGFVVAARFDRRSIGDRGTHELEIAARRKCRTRPGQDRDAYAGVAVEFAQRGHECVHHVGVGNRIAHFRSVQCQGDDRTVLHSR